MTRPSATVVDPCEPRTLRRSWSPSVGGGFPWAVALWCLLVMAACSGTDQPAVAPPPSTTAPPTTLAPAVVLGSAGRFDLIEGQCYQEEPEDDPGASVSSSSAAVDPSGPTGAPFDPVRLVDCSADHDGQVYAATCLGPDPAGALAPTPCPGDPASPWPGDRAVRRAAVQWCLERFEEHVGEPYATSPRRSVESIPTEGAWTAGIRRVVCALRP